jgi:glycosyltransferase involved in cell wall biosynthesis
LFVYPSLYEGFGLPVLEAMACGTPVAIANRSSLPEVAGDAGVYFDPLVVAEMADAIYQVLSNGNFRGELGVRSLEQARRFSWTEAAQQTIAVYRLFT